ncbi:uncharacterized protein CLUP02_01814 [Colletotrichum lupini]|uniref:Uncharacterized protein n=1 Tax=Colletotrichum lupini TaxID=145971 RepID=A0A9Q8SDW7_9PEZI|nr:uncharacterized protein CLUP02_01814 [Colletotrichum lupini]KAK1712161.1 hypothetical protein BDP67DRAFT_578899 [Colletotrichum lupini]UQC75161.1 hypothetical protein CLUP02_01814 [Colletotrichum lupini]
MSRLALIATIISTLTSAAFAVVCTQAETYCGSRLLKLDTNNRKAIEGALASGRQSIDDTHVNQSVFWCAPAGVPVPGDSGLLFVTYCGPENVCQEGGALGGVGDACAASTGGGLNHRRHHHHH